ncbi:unnamed protein product [Moneuplotes crassus]|uniref:Uncharacterized protein n=1 Tax=Euplotes crassus TaxID=5936 RepID=A0AAD1UN85_EUPCR|nr:unnamed protein product [Moneuplotes crassus]
MQPQMAVQKFMEEAVVFRGKFNRDKTRQAGRRLWSTLEDSEIGNFGGDFKQKRYKMNKKLLKLALRKGSVELLKKSIKQKSQYKKKVRSISSIDMKNKKKFACRNIDSIINHCSGNTLTCHNNLILSKQIGNSQMKLKSIIAAKMRISGAKTTLATKLFNKEKILNRKRKIDKYQFLKLKAKVLRDRGSSLPSPHGNNYNYDDISNNKNRYIFHKMGENSPQLNIFTANVTFSICPSALSQGNLTKGKQHEYCKRDEKLGACLKSSINRSFKCSNSILPKIGRKFTH